MGSLRAISSRQASGTQASPRSRSASLEKTDSSTTLKYGTRNPPSYDSQVAERLVNFSIGNTLYPTGNIAGLHFINTIIGVVTSSFAVASTVGLPIGLWLAIYFENLNAPFLAIGVLATCVLILAAICLPSLTSHRTGVHRNPLNQIASVVQQSNHLWAFLFMLSTVFGTFIIVPFIAPYLQANCGRTALDLPVIYAVAGVFTLITLNIIGWATDRFGAKPIFFFCAGGAVVMTLIITNLPKVSLLAASTVTSLFMILASGRIIPAQAMMLRASDPALRGAFMNLNTSVSHFATAVVPRIIGTIVGEEYVGGPLTRFPLAGFIAAACGCNAMAFSFRLRHYSSPNAK